VSCRHETLPVVVYSTIYIHISIDDNGDNSIVYGMAIPLLNLRLSLITKTRQQKTPDEDKLESFTCVWNHRTGHRTRMRSHASYEVQTEVHIGLLNRASTRT